MIIVTQPYLTSIPNLGSRPWQAPKFNMFSLHSGVTTGVPHLWLNISAGVPPVPGTISMSDCLYKTLIKYKVLILMLFCMN